MPKMLITSEVATLCRVSPKTVRRWAAQKILTKYRVGRRVLFNSEEVGRLLKSAAARN